MQRAKANLLQRVDQFAGVLQPDSRQRCDLYCEKSHGFRGISNLRISKNLEFAIDIDYQQCRGIHFFCYHIAEEFAIAVDSGSNWISMIIHAGHLSAECDAAIAVASLGEKVKIHDVLTLENADANVRHESARYQYHRAIRQLRWQMQGEKIQWSLRLLSCFLFCIFNFLQGKLRHR